MHNIGRGIPWPSRGGLCERNGQIIQLNQMVIGESGRAGFVRCAGCAVKQLN
jgi:hypothetical protein